jgi:hypothetical protein
MNRSYSKIRHIQESNQKLEKRIIKEQSTNTTTPNLSATTTPNLSATTTNIWSIVIGYMNEFEDKIKSDTVESSNGKVDNIDTLAAVKELRMFCEDKRDGRTPKPLSQLSNIIFKSIQPQIKNLDSNSQNKYLASGKTTITNRY